MTAILSVDAARALVAGTLIRCNTSARSAALVAEALVGADAMDEPRWSPTFHHMTEFFQIEWVQRTVLVVGGALVGLLLELVVVARAHRIALKTRFKWDDLIVESVRGVPTVWLTCAGIYLALSVGTLDALLLSTMESVLTVILIGSVAIAGMRATGGAVEMLSGRAEGV
ncbi:MAG: hypothetical protein IIC03_04820, partial [Proteobacteria bacterium]|nr:hypothetical protein [Pseudomonadota bacterium]